MAYRYRLEKVLKLRRIEEAQAAERLLEQQRLRSSCQRELQLLEQAWRECRDRLGDTRQGLEGTEFALLCRRARVLERRLELLRQRRAAIEQQLQECRELLEQRVAARRGQQRHREQQQRQWSRKQRRREQRRDDELGRGHGGGTEVLEVSDE